MGLQGPISEGLGRRIEHVTLLPTNEILTILRSECSVTRVEINQDHNSKLNQRTFQERSLKSLLPDRMPKPHCLHFASESKSLLRFLMQNFMSPITTYSRRQRLNAPTNHIETHEDFSTSYCPSAHCDDIDDRNRT